MLQAEAQRLGVRVGRMWSSVGAHRHRAALRCNARNLRHRNSLYELGLHYNYPPCCVASFATGAYVCPAGSTAQIACLRRRLSLHVPCEACAQALLQRARVRVTPYRAAHLSTERRAHLTRQLHNLNEFEGAHPAAFARVPKWHNMRVRVMELLRIE